MNAVDVSVGTFPIIIIITEFGPKKVFWENNFFLPFWDLFFRVKQTLSDMGKFS
jgi:hypothetical protein